MLLCTVKEVERVGELVLAEKPNRSRDLGTRKVRLNYHPRMRKLTARGHSSLALAISGAGRGGTCACAYDRRTAGRQVGAYGRKASRLVVFFGRHGDLATVNFPHWIRSRASKVLCTFNAILLFFTGVSFFLSSFLFL